jgi:NAD(P)-dependent dehydrogenase (short-subunit alcohol dehydrogenase family)
MTKITLITGVSRGFSYAMAEELIRQGYTVFGCARSAPVAE